MATVKFAEGSRSPQARINKRLRPDYADGWRYPLASQVEASTVPTRCCTEVFFCGGQHNGDGVAESYGDEN
jgi:hypothetical protein